MLLSHWSEEGHAHLSLSTVCLLTLKKREEKRDKKKKEREKEKEKTLVSNFTSYKKFSSILEQPMRNNFISVHGSTFQAVLL